MLRWGPFALCVTLLSAACAPAPLGPEKTARQAIRSEAIRAHVTFLGDDLLEGRGTGTRGYDIAAQYVAAQFRAGGLLPAGVDGTFFQPIRFRSALVVPERTTLVLNRAGASQALVWGQDFFAIGDLYAREVEVSGDVVFVGYGVSASDFQIDDYQGIDVRGKVVAILRGGPSQLPPAEQAHFGSVQTKLEEAARRGAVGAIQVADVRSEKVAPFADRVRQARQPAMSWLDRHEWPNGRESDIRVLAVLSETGTAKLLGRSLPASGSATLPVAVTARIASTHSEVTSANIIAVVPGSDPRLRDEYIVYTAHVDHLGIGEPVDGDAIYNGVTDNAGSVAAVIEIGRAFARLDQPQRRSVILLGVTGEERGLLGSDYFAEYPTVPRDRIVANINMDGTNLLFDFLNIVDIGGDHSSLGATFKEAGARMGIETVPDPTPEQNFFIRSDHYSFVRRGIPALFPMTGTKAVDPNVDGAKMQAERFRVRYHQPGDDLTKPLDFGAGAKTAQLNFLIGYLLAQADARPLWKEGDFFGKTFGSRH